eukprot:1145378-Pelagomonas_calceolata.AAC.12
MSPAQMQRVTTILKGSLPGRPMASSTSNCRKHFSSEWTSNRVWLECKENEEGVQGTSMHVAASSWKIDMIIIL